MNCNKPARRAASREHCKKATNYKSPHGERPAKERCKQGDEEERQVRGNHVNANAVMVAGGDGKPLWRPAANCKVLRIEI